MTTVIPKLRFARWAATCCQAEFMIVTTRSWCLILVYYHGPVPWRGDRWSINAYTSRGFVHLDQNQIDQLRSLKFPIGRSRPGMLAHVARVSFEDGELVDVEASYPTEEAEKRKAKT